MKYYCAIRALQDLQDIVGMECIPTITIKIDEGWYVLDYEWRNINWLDHSRSTRGIRSISVMDLPNANAELVRAHLELMDTIRKGLKDAT